LFTDSSPHVRAWAVQLSGEHSEYRNASGFAAEYKKLASSDPSPLVRRYLASLVPHLTPVAHQTPILEGLLAHAEDASDFNLPLLYWYAVESIAGANPEAALQLAVHGKIPLVLQFTARRLATTSGKAENTRLATELNRVAQAKNTDAVLNILRGMVAGFKGRKDVPAPENWAATATLLDHANNTEVASLVSSLSITFGDAKAFAAMRKLLANPNAELAARQNALVALQSGRDKELPAVLLTLLGEPALRGAALRALGGYDDVRTPNAILAVWATLNTEEKRDALNTLAARSTYANALLDAIAAKKILAADVGADVIRSLRNLSDKEVSAKLTAVWGTVRDTPADRAKAMADLKKKLTAKSNVPPDLMLGRAIYAKTCQTCHTLYGSGGKVGPDITGSNRANLDYLLENIIDPSAVIPKDYTATVFRLNNGRTVTGIIRGDNVNAVTVQTANEVLVINKGDIDEQKPTTVSMMPDDQLKPFTDNELRALFAYLQNPRQVPLLATPENAKDLFNGKDLTGWVGDPKLWSVENGEIVGKTSGLKHNEFLKSEMAAENFKLTLKVKLTPNKENSGIQFRSEVLPNGDVKGPQADVGAGWWGKLYEEHGRGILANEGGEKFVKPDEWNDYVVEAIDGHVRIRINGNICTDYKDDKLARRGIFALQLHSGGALEVRFKDLQLEVIAPAKK
jgi:putative heme-binding domain-containing protein